MNNKKLTLLSFKAIPKRGAIELAGRTNRLQEHAVVGSALAVLSAMSALSAAFIASMFLFFPWVGVSVLSFPLIVITAILFIGSAYTANDAFSLLGKYLKEKDSAFCLPENSSKDDVECEVWLHRAVQSYNTLAGEWNDGSDDVTKEELDLRITHRKILVKHRADIAEKIALLRKSVSLQALSTSQPEKITSSDSRVRALSGYGLIEPSSIIK